MFRKRLWIPMLIPLLFLLGNSLFSGQKVATEDPVRTCKSVAAETTPKPPPPGKTTASGHAPGAEWQVCEASETPDPVSPEGHRLPTLPVSAVPENVPAPLKFPATLKNVYHTTRALSAAEQQHLQHIFTAIVRNYNPGRCRAVVWPDFIAAEKAYRAHAAQHLGERLTGTLAGSRYEWQYAQAWAFPEIMEGFVRETDPEKISRFVRAHQIALGDLSLAHNRVDLLDGRVFRMRPNIRYVFRYHYPDGVSVILRDETVYTPGEPRPEVVIDVLNTSDADLERLSGWNFHINPITMQPFQVPCP